MAGSCAGDVDGAGREARERRACSGVAVTGRCQWQPGDGRV